MEPSPPPAVGDAFSKAPAARPPTTVASAPVGPGSAPAAPAADTARLVCPFCWQRTWGGHSGLQQHQRASGRCRYYQRQAQREALGESARLPAGHGGTEHRDMVPAERVESSPSPPPKKEPRTDKKAKKEKRRGKDKGDKRKKPRRSPTPVVKRRASRRDPSPDHGGGAASKKLRVERFDANTFILRME